MTHGPILWEERPGGRQAPLQAIMCLAPVFALLEEGGELREALADAAPDLAPLILELKQVGDTVFAQALEEWDWTCELRHGAAWPMPGTPAPLGMDKAAAAYAIVLSRMAVLLLQFAVAVLEDAAKRTAAYEALTAGKALFLACPEHGERVVMAAPEAQAA